MADDFYQKFVSGTLFEEKPAQAEASGEQTGEPKQEPEKSVYDQFVSGTLFGGEAPKPAESKPAEPTAEDFFSNDNLGKTWTWYNEAGVDVGQQPELKRPDEKVYRGPKEEAFSTYEKLFPKPGIWESTPAFLKSAWGGAQNLGGTVLGMRSGVPDKESILSRGALPEPTIAAVKSIYNIPETLRQIQSAKNPREAAAMVIRNQGQNLPVMAREILAGIVEGKKTPEQAIEEVSEGMIGTAGGAVAAAEFGKEIAEGIHHQLSKIPFEKTLLRAVGDKSRLKQIEDKEAEQRFESRVKEDITGEQMTPIEQGGEGRTILGQKLREARAGTSGFWKTFMDIGTQQKLRGEVPEQQFQEETAIVERIGQKAQPVEALTMFAFDPFMFTVYGVGKLKALSDAMKFAAQSKNVRKLEMMTEAAKRAEAAVKAGNRTAADAAIADAEAIAKQTAEEKLVLEGAGSKAAPAAETAVKTVPAEPIKVVAPPVEPRGTPIEPGAPVGSPLNPGSVDAALAEANAAAKAGKPILAAPENEAAFTEAAIKSGIPKGRLDKMVEEIKQAINSPSSALSRAVGATLRGLGSKGAELEKSWAKSAQQGTGTGFVLGTAYGLVFGDDPKDAWKTGVLWALGGGLTTHELARLHKMATYSGKVLTGTGEAMQVGTKGMGFVRAAENADARFKPIFKKAGGIKVFHGIGESKKAGQALESVALKGRDVIAASTAEVVRALGNEVIDPLVRGYSHMAVLGSLINKDDPWQGAQDMMAMAPISLFMHQAHLGFTLGRGMDNVGRVRYARNRLNEMPKEQADLIRKHVPNPLEQSKLLLIETIGNDFGMTPRKVRLSTDADFNAKATELGARPNELTTSAQEGIYINSNGNVVINMQNPNAINTAAHEILGHAILSEAPTDPKYREKYLAYRNALIQEIIGGEIVNADGSVTKLPGRFKDEDILRMWNEYQRLLDGQELPPNTPVTPEMRNQLAQEFISDQVDIFIRRSGDDFLAYAQTLQGMTAEQLQKALDRQPRSAPGAKKVKSGESVLFTDADGRAATTDARTEKAIADLILSKVGITSAFMPDGSVDYPTVMMDVSAAKRSGQMAVKALEDARKSGVPAEIAAAHEALAHQVNSGIYKTAPRPEPLIRRDAAELMRSRREVAYQQDAQHRKLVARRDAVTQTNPGSPELKEIDAQIKRRESEIVKSTKGLSAMDAYKDVAHSDLADIRGNPIGKNSQPELISNAERDKMMKKDGETLNKVLKTVQETSFEKGLVLQNPEGEDPYFAGKIISDRQMDAILGSDLPWETKMSIQTANEYAKRGLGENISAWYYAVNKNKGNIPKQRRNFKQMSFILTKAGNLGIKVFDIGKFDLAASKAIRDGDLPGLDLFKGSTPEETKRNYDAAVVRLFQNHDSNAPGATGLDLARPGDVTPRGQQMRESIVDFMGVKDIRDGFEGKDLDNNFFRTFRIDRTKDMAPGYGTPGGFTHAKSLDMLKQRYQPKSAVMVEDMKEQAQWMEERARNIGAVSKDDRPLLDSVDTDTIAQWAAEWAVTHPRKDSKGRTLWLDEISYLPKPEKFVEVAKGMMQPVYEGEFPKPNFVLSEGDPRLTSTHEKHGLWTPDGMPKMDEPGPFGVQLFTPERDVLHQEVYNHFLKDAKPSDNPTAIIMAGGPASGKTTLLEQVQNNPRYKTPNAVFVSADDVRTGVFILNADGSRKFLSPPIPEYDVLTKIGDDRNAGVVHKEASAVSDRLLKKAIEMKANVIWDNTMSKENDLEWVRHLQDQGYKVVVIGAGVHPAEAVVRSFIRRNKTGRAVDTKVLLENHKRQPDMLPKIANAADEMRYYYTTYKQNPSGEYRQVADEFASKRAGFPLKITNERVHNEFNKNKTINVDARNLAEVRAEPISRATLRGYGERARERRLAGVGTTAEAPRTEPEAIPAGVSYSPVAAKTILMSPEVQDATRKYFTIYENNRKRGTGSTGIVLEGEKNLGKITTLIRDPEMKKFSQNIGDPSLILDSQMRGGLVKYNPVDNSIRMNVPAIADRYGNDLFGERMRTTMADALSGEMRRAWQNAKGLTTGKRLKGLSLKEQVESGAFGRNRLSMIKEIGRNYTRLKAEGMPEPEIAGEIDRKIFSNEMSSDRGLMYKVKQGVDKLIASPEASKRAEEYYNEIYESLISPGEFKHIGQVSLGKLSKVLTDAEIIKRAGKTFDPEVILVNYPNQPYYGSYDQNTKIMEINVPKIIDKTSMKWGPQIRRIIADVFTHEVRHAWQHKQGILSDVNPSAKAGPFTIMKIKESPDFKSPKWGTPGERKKLQEAEGKITKKIKDKYPEHQLRTEVDARVFADEMSKSRRLMFKPDAAEKGIEPINEKYSKYVNGFKSGSGKDFIKTGAAWIKQNGDLIIIKDHNELLDGFNEKYGVNIRFFDDPAFSQGLARLRIRNTDAGRKVIAVESKSLTNTQKKVLKNISEYSEMQIRYDIPPERLGNISEVQKFRFDMEKESLLYMPKPKKAVELAEAPDNITKLMRDVAGLEENAKYLTPEEKELLTKNTAAVMVKTIHDIPAKEEMGAIAHAGRAKRGWYENSTKAILDVFGLDAPRFTALLAAMSPNNSVENNVMLALKIWRDWKAEGRPSNAKKIEDILTKAVFVKEGKVLDVEKIGAYRGNVLRTLQTDSPSTVKLSGPKVNSFLQNLLGNVQEVTNDTWMANYALVDASLFGGRMKANESIGGKSPGYMAMNVAVRKASEYLTKETGENWTPRDVQETIWSLARSLYELQKTDSLALQHGLLTHEVVGGTPDFASLLKSDAYRPILEQAGYGDLVSKLAAPKKKNLSGDIYSEKGKIDTQGALRSTESRLLKLQEIRSIASDSNKKLQRVEAMIPFEMDASKETPYSKIIQEATSKLNEAWIENGGELIVQEMVGGLKTMIKDVAKDMGLKIDVIDIVPASGRFTDVSASQTFKSPNILVHVKGDAQSVKTLMNWMNRGADQKAANAIRGLTRLELKAISEGQIPKGLKNVLIIDSTGMTKKNIDSLMDDLSQFKDQDGNSFITGSTEHGDSIMIHDAFYQVPKVPTNGMQELPGLESKPEMVYRYTAFKKALDLNYEKFLNALKNNNANGDYKIGEHTVESYENYGPTEHYSGREIGVGGESKVDKKNQQREQKALLPENIFRRGFIDYIKRVTDKHGIEIKSPLKYSPKGRASLQDIRPPIRIRPLLNDVSLAEFAAMQGQRLSNSNTQEQDEN